MRYSSFFLFFLISSCVTNIRNKSFTIAQCNKKAAIAIGNKELIKNGKNVRTLLEFTDNADSNFYKIYYGPDHISAGGDAAIWIDKKSCRIIKEEIYQ